MNIRRNLQISIIFLLFFLVSPPYAFGGENIAVNNLKQVKSFTELDGYKIPTNPATGEIGIGTVCIEMHLATSKQNPWNNSAYKELADLPKGYKTVNYMTGPNAHKITLDQWNERTNQTSLFPGGAFGHMEPEEEMWYMNMRWEYVDWVVDENGNTRAKNLNNNSLKWHMKHRKILVTNLTTGLQAIAYMGDSGPGLDLGSPGNNRIGGLSPDLMYYLSNQQEIKDIPTTTFGKDDKTNYSFEWLEDQTLPLGPVSIDKKILSTLEINENKLIQKEEVKEILPQDFGLGFVRINFEKTSVVGEWADNSVPFLTKGSMYAILENDKNWYKIHLPENNTNVWVSALFVTPTSSATLKNNYR